MIEPFFFRDGRVFGCYHPSCDPSSTRLLIVCPPLFDEYRRSYKALADLANACAAQGVHVLRFDYSGTGESFGLLDEVTLTDWLVDINTSIEEGIALTGAEDVVLVGVRFGATLAAQSRHQRIRCYVFWDPVESGRIYLNWLKYIDSELGAKHKRLARSINIKFENINYESFHLSEKLKYEMEQIIFDQKVCEKTAKSYVITTNREVYASGIYKNCEFTGLDYDWPIYHDGVLTHKPVLEAIARKVI